jgi:hypothetical protein
MKVDGVFARFRRPFPIATLGLLVLFAAGLTGCAAPGPAATPAGVTAAATSTPPATAVAANLTPAFAATAALPAATATLASAATAPAPLAGLWHELALADEQMRAVGASSTLGEAQAHAQAVVDILGGAWGRWYEGVDFSSASDRRGIFPGDRIPGPANDTPNDWAPFGWGIRAYDLGDAPTRQAVQAILGDVALWRTSPRLAYDEIQRAVALADASHNAIGQLNGHATRALAWARLAQVKAATLDEARQFGAAGQQETAAASATVAGLAK